MEQWKQRILDAFNQGITIQSNHYGSGWHDFSPQNQLDKPNLEYGSVVNWRVKPKKDIDKERKEILEKSGAYDETPMMKEEKERKLDTLEKAIEQYCFTSFNWPLNKEGDPVSIPPGQTNPPGYAKHCKIAKRAFLEGALWQAKNGFSKDQMLMFGGFCVAKSQMEPTIRGAELWETWINSFKSQ